MKAQKGSQTVIGNESEPLMPDSSSETPMERHATTEEDENHYLVPTEGLDSYGGQFDYIVPSESQPMEMNIVEVLILRTASLYGILEGLGGCQAPAFLAAVLGIAKIKKGNSI